jgi:hypothetical protein
VIAAHHTDSVHWAGEFGAEDEGRGDTTVVEAWCQLSLSDFIAFCLQRGPVRLLINVAAVAYVVLLLSKSLFFDILCPTYACTLPPVRTLARGHALIAVVAAAAPRNVFVFARSWVSAV